MDTSSDVDSDRQFHLFTHLTEELKISVLRFAANAPLEGLPSPHSTLTHTLNHVNKEFRSICNSDTLWRECLIRVSEQEPKLWKPALELASTLTGQGPVAATRVTTSTLVDNTQRRLGISYKSLYTKLVNDHLRWSGPIFFMPGAVTLGESYGLHFFEHRYRLLISDVMRDQPKAARQGGPISDPVYFVHANQAPLEPTVPAVLVQVTECYIFPDGRATVTLLPVRYVWMERLWVLPDSGNLFCAQCLMMGERATRETKILHRRTALANVMDRLVGTLSHHLYADESSSAAENVEEVD